VVYVGYSIDHRADGRWPLGDLAAAAAAAARASTAGLSPLIV